MFRTFQTSKTPWKILLLTVFLFGIVLGCSDDGGSDSSNQDTGFTDTIQNSDLTEITNNDTGQDSSSIEDTAESTDIAEDTEDFTDVDEDVEDLSDVDEDVEDFTDVDEDTEDTGDDQCGYGEIVGRVCSPNGSDWLFGVEVTLDAIDCSGQSVSIQAFTDSDGYYTLSNVPNGTHVITIKTGSFTTRIENVPVSIGEITDLTGQTTKTCLDRRAAKIAVLTGVFDNFEELLERLGITHSLYEGDSVDLNPNPVRDGQALLANPDPTELLSYDILIINSGEWYRLFHNEDRAAEIEQMRQNILLFVQSGGSLYVSDWAYYWVELAYPTKIDFYGDDSEEGNALYGSFNNSVPAEVLSDDFRNALHGQTDLTLNFNWPAWAIAESSLMGETTVHVQALEIQTDDGNSLENVPVVISFQPTPTSGQVFFTSFHADANSAAMEEVLSYLVFQL